MSAVAGRLASQLGASYLQIDNGGKGMLLGGIEGVDPASVVVLGGGFVGLNAAEVAIGLGSHVTILDINEKRLEFFSQRFGSKVTPLYSNEKNISQAVSSADILIGAVLVPGAKAPKLVSKEMVSKMPKGSVIVDVAVDQGGSVETIHPTSHENPTYEVNGVIHYAVPNMPGIVPYTSTYALTRQTITYAKMIADLGWREAIKNNEPLRKGVNVCAGELTHKPVSEVLGIPLQKIKF